MVKIEIRIQGAVRDNIVCKWVTEEQYNEVISLDKRLNELKGVEHMLDNNDTHLSYYKKGHLGNRDSLIDIRYTVIVDKLLYGICCVLL